MGYVRKNTIYNLTFSDPEMDGLEVLARSVPLGKLMKLTKLMARTGDKNRRGDTESIDDRDLEAIDELFRGFAQALIRWNLEEEVPNPDDPEAPPSRVRVSASLDGIYSQDIDFVLAIITAWIEAVAGVPAPLDESLTSGPPFPEESLPMETLSPSHSS